MAGNPEAVSKFLSGLAVKLQPLWKEEKAEMLKLKEEEVINMPCIVITWVTCLVNKLLQYNTYENSGVVGPKGCPIPQRHCLKG